MITNLLATIVTYLVTNTSAVTQDDTTLYMTWPPSQFPARKQRIVRTTVDRVTTATFDWRGRQVVAELERQFVSETEQTFELRTTELWEAVGKPKSVERIDWRVGNLTNMWVPNYSPTLVITNK